MWAFVIWRFNFYLLKECGLVDLDFYKKTDGFIAGVDEVGRGPLAGPVVGACALIKGSPAKVEKALNFLAEMGITDSKKLTDKKRKILLDKLAINLEMEIEKKDDFQKNWLLQIEDCEVHLRIDEKSPQEIDEINILQASLSAMKESFLGLYSPKGAKKKGSLLIDGNKSFEIPHPDVRVHTLVKGDSKSTVIGLASILAKVYRDEFMSLMSKEYPYYDFEKNAGYPTQKHREAIANHGITPIHRKSFKGVKEFVEVSKL